MFCFTQGLLSFLSAPLIGALSDVWGRKSFLLLTVFFTCAPIPLMKISPWLVNCSRLAVVFQGCSLMLMCVALLIKCCLCFVEGWGFCITSVQSWGNSQPEAAAMRPKALFRISDVDLCAVSPTSSTCAKAEESCPVNCAGLDCGHSSHSDTSQQHWNQNLT